MSLIIAEQMERGMPLTHCCPSFNISSGTASELFEKAIEFGVESMAAVAELFSVTVIGNRKSFGEVFNSSNTAYRPELEHRFTGDGYVSFTAAKEDIVFQLAGTVYTPATVKKMCFNKIEHVFKAYELDKLQPYTITDADLDYLKFSKRFGVVYRQEQGKNPYFYITSTNCIGKAPVAYPHRMKPSEPEVPFSPLIAAKKWIDKEAANRGLQEIPLNNAMMIDLLRRYRESGRDENQRKKRSKNIINDVLTEEFISSVRVRGAVLFDWVVNDGRDDLERGGGDGVDDGGGIDEYDINRGTTRDAGASAGASGSKEVAEVAAIKKGRTRKAPARYAK